MDGYATHQQALIKAAVNSKGDILETGCGFYSTPLLYEICKARGTKLISLVQEMTWAANFNYLKGEHYEQIEVDFTKELELKGNYGMIFLDHEQFVRDRILHINNLLNHTNVLVAHDSNNVKRWNFIEHPVKMEHFKGHLPHTVIITK